MRSVVVLLLVGIVVAQTYTIKIGYDDSFDSSGKYACEEPSSYDTLSLTTNWTPYGDYGLNVRINTNGTEVYFTCTETSSCRSGWSILRSNLAYPISKSENVYVNSYCSQTGCLCRSYWVKSSSSSSAAPQLNVVWL